MTTDDDDLTYPQMFTGQDDGQEPDDLDVDDWDDEDDDFDYSFDDDDEDDDDEYDDDEDDFDLDDDEYEDDDDFDYSFDDEEDEDDDLDDEDDDEDGFDDDDEDDEDDEDEQESYDSTYVQRLRAENARYRTRARDAEKQAFAPLVDALGLGDNFNADNATTDDVVAAVVDTAKKNRDAVRAARVEAAVYKHANSVGINAESAMDSRKFHQKITALDPDADDFDAKIRDAMKGVADHTPRRNAPPARSGGDFTSGNRSRLSANPTFEELRANRRKKRGLD